jgi:alpha-galactosidase
MHLAHPRRRRRPGLAAAAALSVLLVLAFAGPARATADDPAAGTATDIVGATPPMGWNSWNQFGCDISDQVIRQEARALVSTGLRDAGYVYVDIDDCWQAPERSAEGALQADPTRFPQGIKPLADYVHSLGLKLGIYGNPGKRSCAQRNRGYPGLSGSLGHVQQDADTFASWGVDYLKYDWCGANEYGVDRATAFAQMRDALRATGRDIVYSINPSDGNALGATGYWGDVATQWRTTGDIKPVWDQGAAGVVNILDKQVGLARFAGPGHWNDPDMLEVGVVPGGYTAGYPGLTDTEARAHFGMWAMLAAPLIAGADIRDLDATSRDILANREVIAVDQDPAGIEGSRIRDDGDQEVWAKPLADGSVAVALLNRSATSRSMSTTAAAVGLAGDTTGYRVRDLWAHDSTETAGVVGANVPAHGVALYRVTPIDNPTKEPPHTGLQLTGLGTVTGGEPVTATATFTNHGVLPVQSAELGVSAPQGWQVRATSPTSFPAVASGRSVQATFRLTPPEPDRLFPVDELTATAEGRWHGRLRWSTSTTVTVPMTSPPVRAPYRTYSSATDAPARYAQLDDTFGISGAGSDLYKNADAYTTVYRPGAVTGSATVETTVTGADRLSGFGKAGILVRDDATASDTGPEGVILLVSPSGGIQLEWNSTGGTRINAVTPPNGTIPYTLPVHLRLVRTAADTYAGYYSLDGTSWHPVGTATVPGQGAVQDAGMFVTSHATGSPATVRFTGFTVSSQ